MLYLSIQFSKHLLIKNQTCAKEAKQYNHTSHSVNIDRNEYDSTSLIFFYMHKLNMSNTVPEKCWHFHFVLINLDIYRQCFDITDKLWQTLRPSFLKVLTNNIDIELAPLFLLYLTHKRCKIKFVFLILCINLCRYILRSQKISPTEQ